MLAAGTTCLHAWLLRHACMHVHAPTLARAAHAAPATPAAAALPQALGARPGFAVAAFFDYLHGTHNDLAERHLADVAPRQDELAGPAGRRADMVGGAYLAHREDMRRIAPLWLKYTENVRDDPRVCGRARWRPRG